MDKILILLYVDENGVLPGAALEAVTAAQELGTKTGGSLAVGLVGKDVKQAADAVAGAAEKIYAVAGDAFAAPRYATDAAAAEALVKAAEATIVVAPQTSRASRVMGGVSARFDGCVDTHISGIEGEGEDVSVTRWYYKQRIRAQVKQVKRPWFLVIDAGVYAPADAAGSADVESVDVAVDGNLTRTTVKGVATPATDEQTIKPDADVLFVAGAGWTKKQADGAAHVSDAAELILGVLKKANASLGSTKSLVDMEGEGQEALPFMTHLNQIGQTGSTPRHKKGLATCCHGEEPHVVGWRFINERRAINKDANCGWAHGKADVLYIADAFEVVKHLNEILG